MTGPEFRAAIAGYRRGWLAQRWGVSPDTLRRWCSGDGKVPAWVPDALAGLAVRAA